MSERVITLKFNEKQLKRLPPKESTIKKLFALSGNTCVMPDCMGEIIKEDVVVGKIAHIESVGEKGPRHNKKLTPEQLREGSNLILVCEPHHSIIDKKESEYTTSKLQKIKQEHEKNYQNKQHVISNTSFAKIYEQIINQLDEINQKLGLLPEIKSDTETIIHNTEGISEQIQSLQSQTNFSRIILEEKPKYLRGKTQYFTGRDAEINLISSKIKQEKILTISGEGGLGKTALAMEIVERTRDHFELIIPTYLGSLSTFDDILRNFANRLDLKIGDFSTDEKIEIIQNKLNEKTEVLIILDNYEKISRNFDTNNSTEDDVKINAFFESMSEKIHLLITSRYKNNLPGEKIIEIEGLNDSDALDLFIKLSRSKKHNLTEEEIEKINWVLAKLGGHALSIEILARNYRGNDIQKLENMLKILSKLENPRSSESRIKSLTACFDYSLNYIDEKLRNHLFEISSLRSPVSIIFLKNIFGITYDDLEILYEHSLLQKIDRDEFGEISDAYWLYDIHPAERTYLESKKQEYSSLPFLDANKVGLELGHYVNDMFKKLCLGEHMPIRQFLLLTESEDNDFEKFGHFITNSISQAQYFGVLAGFYERLHDHNKALKCYKFLLKFDGAYPENLLPALGNYAGLLTTLGKFELSELIHEQITKHYEEKGDFDFLSTCYSNTILLLTRMGKWDKAYKYGEKAINLNIKQNNIRGLASAYLNFGNTQTNLQKYADALDSFSNAEKYFSELGDKRKVGFTKRDLGNSYSSSGKPVKALEKLNESLIIFKELKDEYEIGVVTMDIGIAYSKSGNYDDAEKYFDDAQNILKQYPSTIQTITICERLAALYHHQKKIEKSFEEYSKGLDLARKLQTPYHVGINSLGLGIIYSSTLYVKKAFEFTNAAIENYKKVSNHFHINNCKMSLNILLQLIDENKNNLVNFKDIETKEELEELIELIHKKIKEIS